MDPILELACEHGLKVIKDCAQAYRAVYKDRRVGEWATVGAECVVCKNLDFLGIYIGSAAK